jgi:hypothetical protein
MTDRLIESVINASVFILIFGALFFGLSWAANKEAELGISGMSSERILVRAELNENK